MKLLIDTRHFSSLPPKHTMTIPKQAISAARTHIDRAGTNRFRLMNTQCMYQRMSFLVREYTMAVSTHVVSGPETHDDCVSARRFWFGNTR